ncbi:MAG: sugar ABC transporter permease YjfF, partial [Treponema sp.]|nr:sugar ABC transporter permease YjfF [Treponema sp.]
MANIFTNLFGKKENRQPLSNTTLLLTITICTFIGMYVLAMIIWGGGFLNPQQFLDLFNNNAYLIVIACGLTIVMITGGIDISVGGSVALITMASVVFMEDHGGGILSSVLISLGIGLAVGLVQGYLVAYLKIQPFIVSLAGMFFTRGMTTIVSKVPRTATNEAFIALKEHYIDIPFLGTYSRNGTWIPSSIEVGVIIAIVVVILLWAMLKWTRFGRNLYA